MHDNHRKINKQVIKQKAEKKNDNKIKEGGVVEFISEANK